MWNVSETGLRRASDWGRMSFQSYRVEDPINAPIYETRNEYIMEGKLRCKFYSNLAQLDEARAQARRSILTSFNQNNLVTVAELRQYVNDGDTIECLRALDRLEFQLKGGGQ